MKSCLSPDRSGDDACDCRPGKFDGCDDRVHRSVTQATRLVLVSLVGLPILTASVWAWERQRDAEVVARQPAGVVIAMSASNRQIFWPVVLETDRGLYPLQQAVSVVKGTALVMEERASGKRFICALDGSVCVQTPTRTLGGRPQ